MTAPRRVARLSAATLLLVAIPALAGLDAIRSPAACRTAVKPFDLAQQLSRPVTTSLHDDADPIVPDPDEALSAPVARSWLDRAWHRHPELKRQHGPRRAYAAPLLMPGALPAFTGASQSRDDALPTTSAAPIASVAVGLQLGAPGEAGLFVRMADPIATEADSTRRTSRGPPSPL